jgi:DNA-binding transcriptional ArsR family regulator
VLTGQIRPLDVDLRDEPLEPGRQLPRGFAEREPDHDGEVRKQGAAQLVGDAHLLQSAVATLPPPWKRAGCSMDVMATDSPSVPARRRGGDADISTVAALFADPTRARVLMALADGRSLPATVLAGEAGVSPQAASTQLKRLTQGGLIVGAKSGRHRYYRLASDRVANILEALAGAAPSQPIRSLRQDTRAAALRRARTCYDHLAGRLGCDLTQALLDHQALQASDGVDTTRRRATDPLSAPLPDHPYRLGPNAETVLERLGVRSDLLRASSARRRPLLRFCLDWSEQRHHLGGRLGATLFSAFEDSVWITRRSGDRAVTVTSLGRQRLMDTLGLSTIESHAACSLRVPDPPTRPERRVEGGQ